MVVVDSDGRGGRGGDDDGDSDNRYIIIMMKVVEILNHLIDQLRTKEVASVKVLWRNQFVEKAMREAKKI